MKRREKDKKDKGRKRINEGRMKRKEREGKGNTKRKIMDSVNGRK